MTHVHAAADLNIRNAAARTHKLKRKFERVRNEIFDAFILWEITENMVMKKILVTLLIASMGAAILAGCGESKKSDSRKETGAENTSSNEVTTEDKATTEDKETESQTLEESGFEGEVCTWTSSGVKLKLTYDADAIEVDKAEDGYSLKLGLKDKYYSEQFDIVKGSVQDFYDRYKTELDNNVANPKTTVVTDDGGGKEENATTVQYNMTETYSNAYISEPEIIEVESGMTVYRFERKYTVTQTNENITNPGDNPEPYVYDVDKYHYVIDVGNNYCAYVFSFSPDMKTPDKELKTDALKTMLDAMYIEIVTE